jgi:hypothetical protein
MAMANCAYLINTTAAAQSRAALASQRTQPGQIFGIVAEGANRLPIPWFLLFRPSDLPQVPADQVAMSMPCVRVDRAVANLENAMPTLTVITGDADIARSYGSLALTMLRRLPLPYVAMDPVEVFMLSSEAPTAMGQRFAAALAGDASAIPHVKALSEYREGVPAYPLDILYAVPGGQRNADRAWNASALDGGFQPNFKFVSWVKAKDTPAPEMPQPVADAAFGEIRDVPGLVQGWLREHAPECAGGELAVTPGSPEQLGLELYVRSAKEVPAAEANAALRQQIAGVVAGRLEPWCKKYGFAWKGVRFSSPEWARR